MYRQDSGRHQHPQFNCSLHADKIQGICVYHGHCNCRLLCRACRKIHSNYHPQTLNQYEELSDLLSGKLVNELSNDMNEIIQKIIDQNDNMSRTNTALIEQIENAFLKAQENIILKLEESKKSMIQEVLKNTQSNIQIKDFISHSKANLGQAYSFALQANFMGQSLTNLVSSLCSIMSLKSAIDQDPKIFSTEEYLSKINLLSKNELDQTFHNLKLSLDKIDQDIVDSFRQKTKETANYLPSSSNAFRNMVFQRSVVEDSPLNQSREEERPQQIQVDKNLQSDNPSNIPNTKPTDFSVRAIFEQMANAEQQGNASPLINVNYEFLRQRLTPQNPSSSAPMINPIERPMHRNEDARSDLGQTGLVDRNRSTSPLQGAVMNNNQYIQNKFDSQRMLFEDIQPHVNVPRQNEYRYVEDSALTRPLNFYSGAEGGDRSPFDGNRVDTSLEPQIHKKRPEYNNDMLNAYPAFQRLYQNDNMGYQINSDLLSRNAKRKKKKRENKKRGNFQPSVSPVPIRNENRTTSPLKILQLFKEVQQHQPRDSREPISRLDENRIEKKKRVVIDAEIKQEEEQEFDLLKNLQQTSKAKKPFFSHFSNYPVDHFEINPTAMIYITNMKQIVTGGHDGRLNIYDLEQNKLIKRIQASQGKIYKIFYIEEKQIILTTSEVGIKVWDYNKDFNQLGTFDKHESTVNAIEYIPELDMVVSGGEEEHIRLWNLENFKQTQTLKIKGRSVHAFCYIPDQYSLAVGFNNGKINIIQVEAQSKKIVQTLDGPESQVLDIKLLKEHSVLFSSGGSEIKAYKFKLGQWKHVSSYKIPGKAIGSFTFSKEQDLMIATSIDHTIHFWKLSSGATILSSRDNRIGESLVYVKYIRGFATFSKKEVHLWKLKKDEE